MSIEQSRLYNFVDDKNNGIPITSSRMDAELNQDITALNQKVIIKATAPSSPIAGMFWLDSSNKFLKQYRNSEWVTMGVVHYGTVMATPQSGDVWIDNSGAEVIYKVRNKANSAWLTLLQTSDIIATIMPLIYPVGSVYSNRTVATNPATLLGFGTWIAIGGFIAGLDGSTEFLTAGQTGGEKTHVLTTTEMPAHVHRQQKNGSDGTVAGNFAAGTNASNATGDTGCDTLSTGGGAAHNTLPPYTVCYLWYRSA